MVFSNIHFPTTNIPKNILDDFDENIEMNNSNRVLDDSDEKDNDSNIGKGVYNYNIDDLLEAIGEEI